jgi:hypothetical protein
MDVHTVKESRWDSGPADSRAYLGITSLPRGTDKVPGVMGRIGSHGYGSVQPPPALRSGKEGDYEVCNRQDSGRSDLSRRNVGPF